MEFSPRDRDTILKLAAQRIVEEIKEAAGGDLASIVIIPVNAAAHMLHKSAKQLPLLLPVTDIGPNSKGVTLRNLLDYIKEKTRPAGEGPTTKKKTATPAA